ncbi:MAG: aminotransferase class I/II-fold pyridoxal phosphate-dependent enzyme [Phycisphaerales bacterium]|nr:aminotransferase class I/II-fold pyridoxal phosphate-dependent enzyme [Planctomycetota bacterium]MCH8507969.1 aminotransferase class I/II-fold pyridoxal phosphate-dependent enzyme [Phycisphaerales bacterium]
MHRDRTSAETFEAARVISPRRKTTDANSTEGLVAEQLAHFGIDPETPFGRRMASFSRHLYEGHADLTDLWRTGVAELANLPREQRIERFSAQRFLAFQLAKILDTLQHPLRTTYQSVVNAPGDRAAKGPYPIFDNVTALFSAKPVITRTATYIYACAEWVEDAFQGRELLHEIYSRLLNPTAVSLANHIVDIECGPEAPHYMAWNFNSGMAAVDAVLAHLVGHRDIILSSRNVYGGTYQLLHDWYAKPSNLDVGVHFFDGYTGEAFAEALDRVTERHKDRLDAGRQIYVYLESPCNPHGHVLDVPEICRIAHERKLTVICDSTVGTPFLHRPLRRPDPIERPDFVIHSYTKDISGHGTTTAGCVIGRNERMFMGKNDSCEGTDVDGSKRTFHWDETLFWNVYYIKGAFLDADKAFEVMTGLHTLEHRMLHKAVSTLTLAEVLSRHPQINVQCSAAPGHPNAPIREKCLFMGLPAPLFTFDFEGDKATEPGAPDLFSRTVFERFFDHLDPVFGHQVSLGTPNTIVLCPAITSHSELSRAALAEAGIAPTTVRVSVGLEDPRSLIAHLIKTARATLDDERPGFSAAFPAPDEIDAIYRRHHADVHTRYAQTTPTCAELMA